MLLKLKPFHELSVKNFPSSFDWSIEPGLILFMLMMMMVMVMAVMIMEGLRMSSSVHEEDRGRPTNGNQSFPAQPAAATRTLYNKHMHNKHMHNHTTDT